MAVQYEEDGAIDAAIHSIPDRSCPGDWDPEGLHNEPRLR